MPKVNEIYVSFRAERGKRAIRRLTYIGATLICALLWLGMVFAVLHSIPPAGG